MDASEKYSLIDKYLSGTLSSGEASEFEQLKENETFREELEFRSQLLEAAKLEGRNQLKERFQNLDTSVPSKSKNIRFPLWQSVAAAVLILVATFFLIKLNSNQYDTDLYASYYEKLPNTLVPIQRGETTEDSMTSAFVAYSVGDYETAGSLLNELETQYPEVAIYQAIIHLENENYEVAQPILQSVMKDENSKYQMEAKWYLGLTFLKLGKLEEAKAQFKEITDSDSRYQNEAEEVLESFR